MFNAVSHTEGIEFQFNIFLLICSGRNALRFQCANDDIIPEYLPLKIREKKRSNKTKFKQNIYSKATCIRLGSRISYRLKQHFCIFPIV